MKPMPARSDHAPRLPGVAIALGLLMPGLGHLYCGRVRRGLLVWAGVLAALVGGLLAWARWLFVPLGPLTVAAGCYVALQIALIADVRRLVDAAGPDYRLRPINHGLSYLAVFLGLGVLPLVLTAAVIDRWMVGSVVVRDRAMFPQMLPGDRLLYDRGAYLAAPPRPGDLVVWGAGPHDERVARVIARAGETVHLRDGRPIIDGRSPSQVPLADMKVPRFDPADQARLDALAGFVEARASDTFGGEPAVDRLAADPRTADAGRAPGGGAPVADAADAPAVAESVVVGSPLAGAARYVVTYDRAARRTGGDPAPVTLSADEVYVLADNRDEALDARAFGRVPLAEVRGRPRHIWLSTAPGATLREGRFGLEVR